MELLCNQFLHHIHSLINIVLPSSETSTVRNGLNIIKLLTKGAPWKSPCNLGYCQSYWLHSRNWWQGPVVEDTSCTSHWTQRSQASVQLRSSQSWKLLDLLPQEKDNHQASYKPSDIQRWPACLIHWCNSGTKIVGVTNHCLIGFKAPSMRIYDRHRQHGWPRTQY